VGARIDIDRIPVLPAVHALFPQDWQRLALHGGEDYELLCTVRPELVEEVIVAAKEAGATLTPIGEIVGGNTVEYHLHGQPVHDEHVGGWDHFGGVNG